MSRQQQLRQFIHFYYDKECTRKLDSWIDDGRIEIYVVNNFEHDFLMEKIEGGVEVMEPTLPIFLHHKEVVKIKLDVTSGFTIKGRFIIR